PKRSSLWLLFRAKQGPNLVGKDGPCVDMTIVYALPRSGLVQLYILLHPIKSDGNAIEYFAREIRRLSERLRNDYGASNSNADLKITIERYNQTRRLLRQLYKIRNTNDSFLKGSDTVALMTAGLLMDRDEYNSILNQIVKEGILTKPKRTIAKRLMVVGPLLDNFAILNQIEDLGAYIAYDSTINGSRYFDLDVETEGDLYINLAKRYLLSEPSPTLASDQPKEDYLNRLIVDYELHGIIYINQKFCEPHIHNYLFVADLLKKTIVTEQSRTGQII
ncbi:MAG: 2-hydroxyacyl-CoA dehydratase family protein, partial [Pirellulales bacterium]